MKTQNMSWGARWESFVDEMGSSPRVSSTPLPAHSVICRDFRVAVPMLCGSVTSARFPDTAPIKAELTSKQLLTKEAALSEMGENWQVALGETAAQYGRQLFELGIDIPDQYFQVGDKIVSNWKAWLQKHHLFMAAEEIVLTLEIIWMHRAMNRKERKLEGVLDQIIRAGGVPCGTDSGESLLLDQDYSPSSITVFWPWKDAPRMK